MIVFGTVVRTRIFAHLPLRVEDGWVWWKPVDLCFRTGGFVGGLFAPGHWYERVKP